MNFYKLSRINGIAFTAREIDVIACIVNVRGVKKIGNILDISPRTVEGYVRSILLKSSLNSQEAIRDFAEDSSQFLFLKEHYNDLLTNKLFLFQISKIAEKIKRRNVSCVIYDFTNKKLQYIISCLKFINIKIVKRDYNDDKDKQKLVISHKEKHLLQLRKDSLSCKNLFISLDKKVDSIFVQKFSNIQFIDCLQKDQVYEAVFKVINLLLPDISLTEIISEFNKKKNNVPNLTRNFRQQELDKEEILNEGKQDTKRKLWKFTLLVIVLLVGLVCFNISKYNYRYLYTNKDTNMNFSLPNKKIFLERKDVDKDLDRIFRKLGQIGTAILVGPGGAGKTIIARNYAKKQKSSVIWELNSETIMSLQISFEGLAYALCNNKSDTQELRSILKVKKDLKRKEQLLLFVQKKLKKLSDWIVIYDNVESFKEIFEYFPYNIENWGNGKVIITTRDSTINGNDYIDSSNVVHVGEISKEEKLILFHNIMDYSPKERGDIIQTELFLKNIPSYPLDVSIAAHYLKCTGVDYKSYLAEIKRPKKEFTELQTLILQDSNQYTKSRYNIVSLAFQNVVNLNSDFFDLALLISLLDSQNIPEELLIFCKNHYISQKFLRHLKKKSLIDKKEKGFILDDFASFSIHRSTQINILADIMGSLSINKRERILSNVMTTIQSYILNQIDLENSIALKNFVRHSESLLEKKHLLNKEDLLSMNNILGIIQYYLGNDKQAKDILETKLDINKKTKETALILTHLGAIYRKIGKNYQVAIEYLKKAIFIYETLSPNNVREALAFTHLGNTYRTLGDFPNAIKSLQKSVNIYRNNSDCYAGEARALGYLGVAYREQGNFNKAENLLCEAIILYNQENYPKYSSVYAGTLAHLGITYRMMEHYEKAEKMLKESLEIYKKIRPENHPDIGRNILNLGIIYGEVNKFKKARELLEKSLRDYENNYGKDHIETGKVLNHLGNFYILSKNFEKAKDVLERASKILQKGSHPESYRSFELLGDLYKNLVKKQMLYFEGNILSKACYNKSLKLSLKFFPDGSVNVIRIRNKIND